MNKGKDMREVAISKVAFLEEEGQSMKSIASLLKGDYNTSLASVYRWYKQAV